MLEIDIHVFNVKCNEISLNYDTKCRQISKKKVSSPSKNYVKESKNVYMHKVDLAPIEIKKERCT